jgi:quinolinate synthase
MHWQPTLPDRYSEMSEDGLAEAISARRAELGKGLVILGHHYQQDQVIRFADFTGDSFKLSRLAAERVRQAGAKVVVFAGVHFMAETADVLTDEDVQVILPDLGAGCSMADMADYDQTVDAWEQLQRLFAGTGVKCRVIPICYMNSTAAIKAFCGEHGGAVCTSSNCDKIFEWALAGGDTPLTDGERVKILFLPDQHLGRNTAAQMGCDVTTGTCVWDPRDTGFLGGNDEETLLDATYILWKGHCSVHMLFRPEHVDQVRAEQPDVHVIVHPECRYDVCQKADSTGSTERIIQAIEAAEPGSHWAVGTEVHLVNRIAQQAEARGVHVRMLSECQCLCTTMYRIDMPHLLWVLDNLAEGKVVNRIQVHRDARKWAVVALQRMLDITAAGGSSQPTERRDSSRLSHI